MATNSCIYYEDSAGVFRGISCNFDGGLNGVGITLYRHYQNIDKIKQLISLGNISSLDKECDRNPNYQVVSSYDREQRHDGYTFAYHRDWKQPFEEVSPKVKNDLQSLEKFFHVYLWKNDMWYSFDYETKVWKQLKQALIEHYKEVIEDLSEEKLQQRLYSPKTIELEMSHDDYIKNIGRSFLLVKKDTLVYMKNDYINIKAIKNEHNYELLVQVVEVIENEAINENYQLVILSKPPTDFAWFYPMRYVK